MTGEILMLHLHVKLREWVITDVKDHIKDNILYKISNLYT